MLFPTSKFLDLTYAAIGALIFMGYIVYDTHMIIKTYGLDEFVWAAVALYLDVINLFLRYAGSFLFLKKSSLDFKTAK